MQSSDSCAQSQGLESACQPSRGVTTPRSVGKATGEERREVGGRKKRRNEANERGRKNSLRPSELVVGDRGKKYRDKS